MGNNRIRIISDCRKDGKAKGMLGIYEGSFNRSVIYQVGGKLEECMYDDWIKGGWDKKYPCLIGSDPENEPEEFWFPNKNPRLILDNGDIIWGDECWWEPYQESKDIKDSEEEVKIFQSFYKEILKDSLKE